MWNCAPTYVYIAIVEFCSNDLFMAKHKPYDLNFKLKVNLQAECEGNRNVGLEANTEWMRQNGCNTRMHT